MPLREEGFVKFARIVVTHYGGPEVIAVIQEDIPVPRAGEVRVKVLAAGVSLPDVLAREGVRTAACTLSSWIGSRRIRRSTRHNPTKPLISPNIVRYYASCDACRTTLSASSLPADGSCSTTLLGETVLASSPVFIATR
jgi:hypothetical protein